MASHVYRRWVLVSFDWLRDFGCGMLCKEGCTASGVGVLSELQLSTHLPRPYQMRRGACFLGASRPSGAK